MVENITQIKCGTMIIVNVVQKSKKRCLQKRLFLQSCETFRCVESIDDYDDDDDDDDVDDDPVITFDEILETTKRIAKKVVLHMFLLILCKLCKLIPNIHYLQKKRLICVML